MSGKLIEQILPTIVFRAAQVGSETVYYNGQSVTSLTAGAVDTRDYDNITFVLNFGDNLGAACTITNAVYENDSDLVNGSTAISGASFTDVNASTGDQGIQTGAIKCKDTKRYLYLRTEVQGSVPTFPFSAVAILGKADSQSTPSGDVTFDV